MGPLAGGDPAICFPPRRSRFSPCLLAAGCDQSSGPGLLPPPPLLELLSLPHLHTPPSAGWLLSIRWQSVLFPGGCPFLFTSERHWRSNAAALVWSVVRTVSGFAFQFDAAGFCGSFLYTVLCFGI
jgi:hypothetical protein